MALHVYSVALWVCLIVAHCIPLPIVPPVVPHPRALFEPTYNSSTHLFLEAPNVTELLSKPSVDSNFSHSAPFRILSDEGIRAWHSVLLQFQGEEVRSQRGSICLRGLVYKSTFVRDSVNDPILTGFLSNLVGKELEPFDHTMNQAHVNYGYAGQGGADVWHVDSHPMVLVIMLTTHGDEDGGELLISPPRNNDTDWLQTLSRVDAGDAMVQRIRLPLGYGILIHGSEVPHAVAPLTQGPARITLTNAYQFRDPFIDNKNSLRTWRMFDGGIADFEYYRSQAWRTAIKLQAMATSAVGEGWDNGTLLGSKLKGIAEELQVAAAVLADEASEPSRVIKSLNA